MLDKPNKHGEMEYRIVHCVPVLQISAIVCVSIALKKWMPIM